MNAPLLRFESVSKRFGGTQAVDAVTLEDAKRAARRLWGQGLLTVIVGHAPQAAAVPASAVPPAAPN